MVFFRSKVNHTPTEGITQMQLTPLHAKCPTMAFRLPEPQEPRAYVDSKGATKCCASGCSTCRGTGYVRKPGTLRWTGRSWVLA